MKGVPGYTVTELGAVFKILLIAASAAVCKVVVKILKVSSRFFNRTERACIHRGFLDPEVHVDFQAQQRIRSGIQFFIFLFFFIFSV